MDITRFLLYTALAIITYLMLLQWQEDYPPRVEDGTAGQVQESIVSTVGDVPSADLPAANSIPANQPALSDIPIVPVPETNTGGNSTESVNTQANPGSVFVKTDTLDLEISLLGGDITYLALPRYLKQLHVPDGPFVILDDIPNRNFVAQSGLIGRNGIDANGRAAFRTSTTNYSLGDGADELNVDLEYVASNGVQITKRFNFRRNSYAITVSYLIDNQSADPWQANLFGQIKRDNFDDPSSVGGFGATFLGFVTTAADDPYIKVEIDDIDTASSNIDTTGGWIGFSQHYFLTAWVPDSASTNRLSTRKNNSNQYIGEFTGEAVAVAPSSAATISAQFYAGPKDQYVLEGISPNLGLTIDYGFLWFLAAPIYWVLTRINELVGNYGVSIILLTVFVKSLLYKLSETQYRSMAGMRRLMPKMQQLKESYGDDKMKLQKATMDLYKKEKINPFGGCLPMLVQMPVFVALYWVLLESVELRHAPFFLWIYDLSVRDPFFILPLLMGATMYLQTSLSPTPADPMQAKVMKFMPIMMTGLFLMFPAGLVLYWFVNGALGILQQWYITRKIDAAYEAKKAANN